MKKIDFLEHQIKVGNLDGYEIRTSIYSNQLEIRLLKNNRIQTSSWDEYVIRNDITYIERILMPIITKQLNCQRCCMEFKVGDVVIVKYKKSKIIESINTLEFSSTKLNIHLPISLKRSKYTVGQGSAMRYFNEDFTHVNNEMYLEPMSKLSKLFYL